MGKTKYNTPLTEQERLFAEQHHRLIPFYLSHRGLAIDDWYGLAAIGFIKAVKIWFQNEKLHQYAFSTIATHTMRSAIKDETRKKRIDTISLDVAINGYEALEYNDVITYRDLSYLQNSTTKKRHTVSRNKSKEIIAIETMLISEEKSICFEYETVEEARKKSTLMASNRYQKKLQEMYSIKQRGNCVTVSKTEKFLQMLEQRKEVIL